MSSAISEAATEGDRAVPGFARSLLKKNNTMMLSLVIVDKNPQLLSAWSEYFQDFPEVVFKNIGFSDFWSSSKNIDAILMRWIFAAERYGMQIQTGRSQIIRPMESSKIAPWIITTPPLNNDTVTSLTERDYLEFKLVFEAIETHNESEKEPKIKVLGFGIEFLYGFRNHIPYDEVKGVYQAYSEYRKLKAKN